MLRDEDFLIQKMFDTSTGNWLAILPYRGHWHKYPEYASGKTPEQAEFALRKELRLSLVF